MPRYYSTVNGIIVDYPESAAVVIPTLKRIPSERAVEAQVGEVYVEKVAEPITEADAEAPVKTRGTSNAK